MIKLYQKKDWLYQKYWVERLSLYEMGEICKVCFSTISYWLKKHKMSTQESNKMILNKEWLHLKYVVEELTQKQIAKLIGRDRKLISRWLKKYNIHIRSKSESAKNMKNFTLKKGHIPWNKDTKGLMPKPWNKGKKCPQLAGENNGFYGKHISEEIKQILRAKNKINSKRNWKDKKYREKIFRSWEVSNKRRPTNPEKVFDRFTPDIIRYVGDGSWWKRIKNGKRKYARNPDFKVTGQNKVIEIYGDYWHRNDNPKDLIKEYKEVGLNCLVFWEHEVYEKPERLLEEVNDFIKTEPKQLELIYS